MPKAFWNGVISFGLVAIPVKMYVGTESKPLSFHLLHKKCLTRPKQVLHCETDDEYFNIQETVRGYEVAKDQYVVLEDSDLDKVPIVTSHAIDISGFVDAGDVDPIYYYGCHYIEPEELGIKPFQLLREALKKTGRVGIAKVSFQRREHLGLLRPFEQILVLHTLHYENEILPREGLTIPAGKVGKAELDMAVSLIKAMEKEFDPKDYRDEYQDALKKIVDAKMAGKKFVAPPVPKVEIGDLMASLRASIRESKKVAAVK